MPPESQIGNYCASVAPFSNNFNTAGWFRDKFNITGNARVAEGNNYDVKVAVGMVKAALTNVCIICQINTDIQLQS